MRQDKANNQREQGFNVYLQGANNQRVTDQQARNSIQDSSNRVSLQKWNQQDESQQSLESSQMQQDLQLIKRKKQEIRQSKLQNQSKLEQESRQSQQVEEDNFSYNFDNQDVEYIRQSMINFNKTKENTFKQNCSDIDEEIQFDKSVHSDEAYSEDIQEDFSDPGSPIRMTKEPPVSQKPNFQRWDKQNSNPPIQKKQDNISIQQPVPQPVQVKQPVQVQQPVKQPVQQTKKSQPVSKKPDPQPQKKKLTGNQLIKKDTPPQQKRKNMDTLITRINHLEQNQKDYLILVLEEIERGKLQCASLRELKNIFNQQLDLYDTKEQLGKEQSQNNQLHQNEQQNENQNQIQNEYEQNNKQSLKLVEEPILEQKLVIQNEITEPEIPLQIPQMPQLQGLYLPGDTPKKGLVNQPAENKNSDEYEIVIKIMDNYGAPSVIGLTELQIFDNDGKNIIFYGACFQIKNATHSNKLDLVNLLSGRYETIDENDMWYCQFSKNKPIELKINIKSVKGVGGICIWNYNKSLLESGKGAKSVEIFINESLVWQGDVKKGCGNEYQDYGTEITFQPDLKLQLVNNIVKKNENQQEKITKLDLQNDSFFKKKENNVLEKSSTSIKSQNHPKTIDPFEKINSTRSKKEASRDRKKRTDSAREVTKHDKKVDPFKNQELTIKEASIKKEEIIKQEDKHKKQRIQSSKAQKLLDAKQFDTNIQQQSEVDNLDKIKLLNQQNQGRVSIEHFQQKNLEEFKRVQNDVKETLKVVEDQMNKLPKHYGQSVPEDNDCLDMLMNQKKPKQSQAQQKKNQPVQKFKNIPLLPSGKHMSIQILSNWGDSFYVGLSGIEIFNDQGLPIKVQDNICYTQDQNFNSSQLLFNDPRTVEKIFDGVYFTQDELHSWLGGYPYNSSFGQKSPILSFDLPHTQRISMIRIWNYNKSRQHAARGVKNIVITLDDSRIFGGPISKAPGTLFNPAESCEYILFTQDQSLLSKINSQDWLNQVLLTKELATCVGNRPPTSQKPNNSQGGYKPKQKMDSKQKAFILQDYFKYQPQYLCNNLPLGSKITLYLQNDDAHYIGLTQVQLFGHKGLIKITQCDSNCPALENDPRSLNKLINSVQEDPQGGESWLAQKDPFGHVNLHFEKQEIIRIFIKNYQKTPKRGVKGVDIAVDGCIVYQGDVEEDLDISFDYRTPNRNIKAPRRDQVVMVNERQLIQGEIRKENWGDDERPMTSVGY